LHRAALCIAALALLAACSDGGPEAAYRTYLERLNRTLEASAQPPARPAYPRPPRPGALRLPIASDSLDTLDFLALSGCAVQVTIGRRNSSLGRMAAPSQRLLLELEYLRLAPACVEQLRAEGRSSLADTLDNAWRLKQSQLPALLFNATLGSEEYRAFWQAAATPGGFPRVTTTAAEQALSGVNSLARRWLGGDYRADNLDFERLLGEVGGGGGGRLLGAMALQASWLEAANESVRERMARGPLCAPGTRHAAADILPVVVEKYFVGDIQPRSAAMHRDSFQLSPPARELETLLQDVLPEDYRAWQARRDDTLAWAEGAPRRHVEQLLAIQAPCE
jgi:hypothetical protein